MFNRECYPQFSIYDNINNILNDLCTKDSIENIIFNFRFMSTLFIIELKFAL